MVRVTVLYKNSEGARFDFDYYVKTHLPLARERLRDFGIGRFEVDKGIEMHDGQKAIFLCIAHVEISSVESFKQGFEKHGEELLADIPKYTNIEPEIQISEVVVTD